MFRRCRLRVARAASPCAPSIRARAIFDPHCLCFLRTEHTAEAWLRYQLDIGRRGPGWRTCLADRALRRAQSIPARSACEPIVTYDCGVYVRTVPITRASPSAIRMIAPFAASIQNVDV